MTSIDLHKYYFFEIIFEEIDLIFSAVEMSKEIIGSLFEFLKFSLLAIKCNFLSCDYEIMYLDVILFYKISKKLLKKVYNFQSILSLN